MFYLTTHSTHFIYGYMASDIWLRTILIVRKETRCHHIGYSYRLTARVLLYAPSHRQDNTYHGLCYTSCGALAGTRNSSMGPPHEGSIQREGHGGKLGRAATGFIAVEIVHNFESLRQVWRATTALAVCALVKFEPCIIYIIYVEGYNEYAFLLHNNQNTQITGYST